MERVLDFLSDFNELLLQANVDFQFIVEATLLSIVAFVIWFV